MAAKLIFFVFGFSSVFSSITSLTRLTRINSTGSYMYDLFISSSSQNIEVWAMTTDSVENLYITGIYKYTVTFRGTDATTKVVGGNSVSQGFVAKYSSTGVIQWVKAINCNGGCTQSDPIQTSGIAFNNNVLAVTAYVTQSNIYDGTTVIGKPSSGYDGVLLLINAATGSLQSFSYMASAANDYLLAVIPAATGFDVYGNMRATGNVDTTPVTVSGAAAVLFHYDDSTCNQFSSTSYGAPKPTIQATASGQNIAVTVTMPKNSPVNTGIPVFHRLDTKQDNSNLCITTAPDQTVNSAGVAWVHTTDGCAETYTMIQTLDNIQNSVSNNNWVTQLSSDGRTITYTLPVYATYSVNRDTSCVYVGYKSLISFQTQLSVVAQTSEFFDADNSAKFVLQGLRVTTGNAFEVQGMLYSMVPSSTLGGITFTKVAGSIPFGVSSPTCAAAYPAGCSEVFSVALSSLGSSGTDISGNYAISADVIEGGLVTRAGVTITLAFAYTIPNAPTVVNGDTITTNMVLFTDSTYLTARTTAYQAAANALFIQNAISDTSPAIPVNTYLTIDDGYLCCFQYASSISTYDPVAKTGGCADATGKTEQVRLVGGTTGVTITPANAGSPKRFRVQVALSSVFNTTNHAAPLTCQVLLVSKLTQSTRKINAITDGTYVSTTSFDVQPAEIIKNAAERTFVSFIAVIVAVVALMW
jgi:hypothetical protein